MTSRVVTPLHFALDQSVRVKAIGMDGYIFSILISRDSVEYQVKGFNNGNRVSEWFRDHELEAT